MTHKKEVAIVRKFLKKTQAWVNKTPGVLKVSMEIEDKNVTLAEIIQPKCSLKAISTIQTPRRNA